VRATMLSRPYLDRAVGSNRNVAGKDIDWPLAATLVKPV
jgi:hypothetical protein